MFHSVFPIRDFNETASLEFVSYTLEKPKYDVQECLQRGMTYAAPIKVTIRLIVWDNPGRARQNIRDVKEQEVYFGEIPVMTENGTFIINGTERVIVSPAAPLARHLLRHRPIDGGHLRRQEALLLPRDPVPRLVARHRVRPQGPDPRAHRPAPQAPRNGAAEGARLLARGAALVLLRARDRSRSTAAS